MHLKNSPYLSIVVTSRNDNHGGDLLSRMQHFVTGIIEQCNRHQLDAELIIVEWNPPAERPPLKDALKFPKNNRFCPVRIIKVPREIHRTFNHCEHLPLFQMLGKNVGIRRAYGKFVLATNIDILFSDSLIKYLKKKLKPGYSYRVDRLDVPNQFPNTDDISEILKFCRENILYANTRFGTIHVQAKRSDKNPLPKLDLSKEKMKKSFSLNPIKFVQSMFKLYHRIIYLLSIRSSYKFIRIPLYKSLIKFLSKRFFALNSNACGDFTLLSATDWANLKGYPEWDVYSWNLDGILLLQAKQQGLKEIDLSKPIYHIDHGGGFSSDDEERLFRSLDSKGISYVDNSTLKQITIEIEKAKNKITYNDENWGLAQYTLEETTLSSFS